MAVREFKLPDVGEGVAEGELIEWLVEQDQAVSEDDPVAVVETDKAQVDVPSPVDGTVRELFFEPGDIIPVGDVFVTFEVAEGTRDSVAAEDAATAGGATDGAEAAEADEAGEAAAAGASDEAAEARAEPVDAGEPAADDGAAGEAAEPSGRVFAPPSVRRLARELGVDLAAVEGTGPSGRVTEGDVRTAATADDAAAAGDGTAGEGGAAAGAEESADPEAAAPPAEPVAGPSADAAAPEAAGRDRTLAAPATRRVADELGVDLDDVPAVEERDGEAFVTSEAVREYAEAQQAARAADAEVAAAGAGAAGAAAEERPREERIPYRGIRRTIGEAMETSKYSAPHVTHHDTVDVTELVETRAALKPVAEEQGIRLTYMPFVLKALVAALDEHPILNSQLDEENEEILVKGYYHVGIAVATDAGLMVPVVEDVDAKGMLQLASEVDELARKARDRSVAPEELRGSTISVTNFGAIGGEYATPIINYPETAIVGLGELKQRPMVVDGEARSSDGGSGTAPSTGDVEARWTLPLSISIDHRVVDGAEVARFAETLMEYLANPALLLLE